MVKNIHRCNARGKTGKSPQQDRGAQLPSPKPSPSIPVQHSQSLPDAAPQQSCFQGMANLPQARYDGSERGSQRQSSETWEETPGKSWEGAGRKLLKFQVEMVILQKKRLYKR